MPKFYNIKPEVSNHPFGITPLGPLFQKEGITQNYCQCVNSVDTLL